MVYNQRAMKRKQVPLLIVALMVATSLIAACSVKGQPSTKENQLRGLIRQVSNNERLASLLEPPCLETADEQAWQNGDTIQQLISISHIKEILINESVPSDQIVAILLRGRLVDYSELPLVHRRLGHHFTIVLEDSTCYRVQWDGVLEHGGMLGTRWFAVG